jgi:hypothetical protein
VPEADLPAKRGHLIIHDATFADLFWKATWPEGDLPDLDREYTYVFELTSPYNRVVVRYEELRATLLVARHTATGRQVAPEKVGIPGIPLPKKWSLSTPAAVNDFVQNANPAEIEGAVVCDTQFRRLKVKSKAWVLASTTKDAFTLSRRGAIEQIILGHIDDVVPIIDPGAAKELLAMQAAWLSLCETIDHRVAAFRTVAGEDRRLFAQQVLAADEWTEPYFALWVKKAATSREWMVGLAEAGKLTIRLIDIILSKTGFAAT